MGESCTKLSDLALGVCKPWAGQEDMYCGIGSCGAFKGIFLNELTPVLYAKGAIGALGAVATGITFITGAPVAPHLVSNNAITLFESAIGDAAAAYGAKTNFPNAPTLAETNYPSQAESPVSPTASNFRFCTVGIAVSLEQGYFNVVATGVQEIPDYITQVPEYRETIREQLLNNTVMTISKGLNTCQFQLGLLCQYTGSTAINGGDVRGAGRQQGPLGYTPLNAVLVEESYLGAEKMAVVLSLKHGFVVRPTSVPVVAEALLFPVRVEKYGFRIAVPGEGSFYAKLPEEQKPPGMKAQGVWGG